MHRTSEATGRALRHWAAAAALVAIAGTAQAADTIWDHNGSQMLWTADGGSRIISYLVPRPGLAVAPGTILFEGRRVGDTLEGTARIFREGCPPAEYFVSGAVTSETDVTLRGSAPVRAQSGCELVGYSDTSANAVLRFTYLRSAPLGDEPLYGVDEGPAMPEADTPLGRDEPPGYASMAVPLPGGSAIVVGIHTNVGSHAMPDMIEASLTCASGASHSLTAADDPIYVCTLDEVGADVIGRNLFLDASTYNDGTGACDPIRIAIPYGGYCR